MANWAIVIGIDQYWTPEACLKGAVRDALQMKEWLLNVNGGNVPDRNLFLLLAPSQGTAVPDGLQYLDATQERIIQVIQRVVQQSGGQGERLFFYYSGHGLICRVNFSDEQALIPTDFTDRLTIRSLGLRSILEYMEATQFKEQYFFIDSCRNIPWDGEFRIGEWPLPQRRNPSFASIQQFVFYATSPGVKAAQIQEAGNERGAFTETLLDGLKGKGNAKAWAWDTGTDEYKYIVRVDRLFEFVLAEVSKKQLLIADDATRRLIQVPRLSGERGAVGGSNPILARFPADAFPQETLSVFLEPPAIAQQAEITVERETATIAKQTHITAQPVKFELQPKEYSVRASALDHEPERKRWFVELYHPQQLTISLVQKPSVQPSIEPKPPIRFEEPMMYMGSEPPIKFEEPMMNMGPEQRLAQLIVETSDYLASLEVADNTGNVLKLGQGRLVCENLSPGFYQARLRLPEGQIVEEMVELSAGETETVRLHPSKQPQTRLTREVIESANFQIDAENALHVSEEMGSLGSAQISTILTLAGSVATYDENQLGAHRLRSLGLKSFKAAVSSASISGSGLQILFGTESGSREEAIEFLSGMKLRLWPREQLIPESFNQPVPLSTVDGLAEFACSAQPGSHWLAIESPGQKPILFALAMLPGRLTMIVFHWNADGQVRIFQYLPHLESFYGSDESSSPNNLRRLELMQRFYMSGRLDHIYENAIQLLYGKWEEPIAGLLGGYLMLKLGKALELELYAQNMTTYFRELSDGYVLKAEYEASLKNDNAAKADFRTALDRGIPIFADGLTRLFNGIQQYGIEHPHAALIEKMYKNRIKGLLWSAWTPDDFSPGKSVDK